MAFCQYNKVSVSLPELSSLCTKCYTVCIYKQKSI